MNYIATARTEQVKEGPGILHAVIIGTTAAGTIDIIDSVSGSTPIIASFKASVAEKAYVFDVAFSTGLKVTSGANSLITILYQ